METIFGLSTLFGKSGVAVIRVSGDAALAAAEALGVINLKPREAKFAKLRFEEQIIDEALVLYFNNPASFTGEDVVEFHTHGSVAVIKKILEILAHIDNCRMAEPGEFSRRAFANGKMDLTEAEGLSDLIEAETDAQHKQAVRQMQGVLGKIYDDWREDLVRLLARVEAYIDFPEEDLPQELIEEIQNKISNLKSSILNHLSDNHIGEKIREGLYVVILGAPNVGKSSLLNFLAKRDAAIVSDIAGTTRDVVEVQMDIAGVPVIFADTAGIRESSDAIESEGIKRALERAENADFRIVMFEGGNVDNSLIRAGDLVVENKIDISSSDNDSIKISIKDGLGMDDLIENLSKQITDKYSLTESATITRARHRIALEKAVNSLGSLSFDKPIELIGEDLRYAASNLGSITGKIDVEELLDEIFSSFCIGK